MKYLERKIIFPQSRFLSIMENQSNKLKHISHMISANKLPLPSS